MTLIVGVRCKNGVVMAADRAATFASYGGVPTIRDEHIQKIRIVENMALMGASGSVAMAQRIFAVFQSICNKTAEVRVNEFVSGKGLMTIPRKIASLNSFTPAEAAEQIRNLLHERVFLTELQAAALANQAGWKTANEAISTTLLAFPTKSGITLFSFNAQGMPEEVTESLFCCNIGSGQPIADPFMAFLRKTMWDEQMPTVEQAILGVVWCLEHAIGVNPGGIGGDTQVFVLKQEKNIVARELSREELQEHLAYIADAEKHLKTWGAGIPPKPASSPPLPPTQPGPPAPI